MIAKQLIRDAVRSSIESGETEVLYASDRIRGEVARQLREECESEDDCEFSGKTLDGEHWSVRIAAP